MTSPPSPLAVGDELPAAWLAQLLTATATAVQFTSWGSGFLATPPPGATIIRQAGWISATTNSTGAVSITLPAPFPSGLAWWTATTTNNAVGVIRPALTGSSSSVAVVVCYTLAGSLLASAATSFYWEAVGW